MPTVAIAVAISIERLFLGAGDRIEPELLQLDADRLEGRRRVEHHFRTDHLLNKIPTRILDLLRTSRLLFLGYALEDWNFRVLLRRLQSVQREGGNNLRRHWAFLLDADPVEVRFWEKRGVNLYQVSLDAMLANLLQNLVEKVA